MAEFGCTGLDGLMLSLQEIAEIPEDVEDEILNAQADVVVQAQRKKIKAYGIFDPKSATHVADSVKKSRVKIKKDQRVIYVTPTGTRKRGKTVTRNAEIAFVNEFGKRGQAARPAIADANEASAEETTHAGLEVYSRWLASKDL